MIKIAILTSGGDASGMNSCLSVLIKTCVQKNYDVFVIPFGYKGLIENNFTRATISDVKDIFNLGGTYIKTSRCPEFFKKEGVQKAYDNLVLRGIDFLIVIGGNGSLQGAYELSNLGAKILFIPATIDNDLGYTNQTLGFDTAVNNAVDAIQKIKQTMQSHERGMVIETMGRNCSDIAIYSAIASQSDVLITEKMSFEKILKMVQNCIDVGIYAPMVIVKEYLLDVKALAEFLEDKTKIEFKYNILGYLQRGGSPTVFDRILATELAVHTINLISENKYNLAVGKQNNKLIETDLFSAVKSSVANDNLGLKKIFENL